MVDTINISYIIPSLLLSYRTKYLRAAHFFTQPEKETAEYQACMQYSVL